MVGRAVERVCPSSLAGNAHQRDAADDGARVHVGDAGRARAAGEERGNRDFLGGMVIGRSQRRTGRRERRGVVDARHRKRGRIGRGTECGRAAVRARDRQIGPAAGRAGGGVPRAEEERGRLAVLRVRRVSQHGRLWQEQGRGGVHGSHVLVGRAVERIGPGSVADGADDGDPADDGVRVAVGDDSRVRAVVDDRGSARRRSARLRWSFRTRERRA